MLEVDHCDRVKSIPYQLSTVPYQLSTIPGPLSTNPNCPFTNSLLLYQKRNPTFATVIYPNSVHIRPMSETEYI